MNAAGRRVTWARNKAKVEADMTRGIDYGNLMHDAMRGLIRSVMEDVAQNGLPGAHHFFITVDTGHPDMQMADWLRDRYPEEITLVVQNWFDSLAVDPDGFAITLNFGNSPEPLYIPFDAISTFVDPSVEFGLRFELQGDEDEDDDDDSFDEAPMLEDAPSEEKSGEVVSLDKFRK